MRSDFLRSRPTRIVFAAALAGVAVAGCSQDSTRYADDPFSNPFSSRSDVTGSVSSTPGQVESRPLDAPQSQAGYNPPPTYSSASTPPRAVPAAPAPTYNAPQQIVHNPNQAQPYGQPGWRSDGGTAVTLQYGETVDIIARRYGVPTWAILRANNLADASRVQPGTRLVIPSYQGPANTTATASAPPPPAPARAAAPAPAPTPARGGAVHVVNKGDTLYSLGRRYSMSHTAIAQANGIHDQSTLRIGQRLTIPGGAPATAARATQFSPPPSRRAEAPAVQSTPTPQKAALVAPTAEAEEQPRSLGGSPQFRWPVRGRVISGFGAKANGQHNDGINLAVPEGTEVKAAEGGTVAYAGNELKGYGNLVLLKHADGWMTAYAHNSQILVKRGDTIRRGQTIARAGQTGGVSSPQVHFEIRRGSSPVDPTQYLAAI